jgi:hypothetical protein
MAERRIANPYNAGSSLSRPIKYMRGSYSGNTLAFQANADSSILLPRSSFNMLKESICKYQEQNKAS